MASVPPKLLPGLLLLLLLGGCSFPVRDNVDAVVCDLAAHPLDVQPVRPADQSPQPAGKATSAEMPELQPIAFQSRAGEAGQGALNQRLRKFMQDLSRELPGGPVTLPKLPPVGTPEYKAAIARLYPPLPELGPDPIAQPGPEGRPLTLADLQNIAMSSSPAVRQAAAAVEAARGATVQARLYPNPNFGYEGDVMGTGGTAGLHGAWFEQIIKTGGKLKVAESAALMDFANAQLALRKAQADLAAQVRAGYFGMLVARRNLEIARALARFTNELYRINVEQAEIVVASYEPAQMRVLAMTAVAGLIQARNGYVATWAQLAANMGVPRLPLTELAGDVTMPVPLYEYDQVLARVLSSHTDVLTADNSLRQARFNLHLAKLTPYPDVDMRLMIQKDTTTIPHEVVPSVVLGVPVPLWNRNQGGIMQAQGNLMSANEQPHAARNDLTGRVADAFRRYMDNRAIVEIYARQIIPDQVRAYLGTAQRHLNDPAAGFADVVVAQQLLAGSINTYVTTLGNLWTAVVDLSHLLQTTDLFQAGQPTLCVPPIPDLDHLFALPCCHPCSPLRDLARGGPNGSWSVYLPLPSTSPATGAAGPKPAEPKKPEPQPAPPLPPPQGKADEPLLPDYPADGFQNRQRGFRRLPWQQ